MVGRSWALFLVTLKARGMTSETRLEKRLRAAVSTSGPLPFHEFMEMALYDPTDGYYTGRANPYQDYFTSVTVHPSLFGQMLAAHLEDIWLALEKPTPFRLVELGSSDGQLAQQIRVASSNYAWGNLLEYTGIEHASSARASGALDTLYRTIEDIPPAESRAVISNEFFDAQPVRRARRVTNGWVEECVGYDGTTAIFVDRPPPTEISVYANQYGNSVPLGGHLEIRQNVDSVYAHVSRIGERVVMTTIDYGGPSEVVHDQRLAAGTLLSYRKHYASDDILSNPGQSDLTSHVNFTQLIDCGHDHGLYQNRMNMQADFLTALGIGEHLVTMQTRPGMTVPKYTKEREAVFQLVSPTDLGRFQVLTQAKDVNLDMIRGLKHAPPPQRT
jgi:SAM-dependent MidA family methyltransferase